MRLYLFNIVIFLSIQSRAQNIPPIISKVAKTPNSTITFSHNKKGLFQIPDLPLNFQNEPQHILKTTNKLLLIIPGSGRLYEIVLIKDSLITRRLDNTYFTGNNFQSLSFNLRDTIYSYGGYGFWHFNGDLRIYSYQIGEWSLKQTNKYLPKGFTVDRKGNFRFIDTANNTLFISGPRHADNHTINQNSDVNQLNNILYKLDIPTAKWSEIGNINDTWHTYFGYCPFGLIAKNEISFQILDIKNNQILNIKGKTLEKLINTPKSNEYQDIMLSYCIGYKLYVGDFKNWIDSVYIDPKDLIPSGELLYTKRKTILPFLTKEYVIIFLLLISNLFIIIISIIKKFKKPKGGKYEDLNNTNNNQLDEHLTNLLNEREKQFLEFIYNRSCNNLLTSIQEINDFLGVARRTLEVQKRIRTDLIQSINQKCIYLSNNPSPILSRIRSASDRRMFDYFIENERKDDVINILNFKK